MDGLSLLQAAKTKVETLKVKPSNEELLQLYSLYKQGSEGDTTNDAPTGFDFRAAAKHNAWIKHKGKSTETAIEEYVQFVEQLILKYQ